MRKVLKSITAVLVFLALVIPSSITNISAANRTYEVTFKSGSQGVFDVSDLGPNATYNEKHTSVTYEVEAGDTFPDVPELIINEGYRNNEWSKELPAVNSTVEEKQVYVAKYTKLVNAVEFTVRYVDANGVDLETPMIYTTDLGTEEVVRAKTIDGYTPDALQKRLTVSREEVEIQFVYTPNEVAEPPVIEQIVYVEGEPVYVDVVQEGTGTAPGTVPGTTTPGGGDAGTGDDTGGDTPTEVVEDPDTPQGGGDTPSEVVEDPDTPQSDGDKDSTNNNALYVAGGVGIVAIIALIAYMLSKKKKQAEE